MKFKSLLKKFNHHRESFWKVSLLWGNSYLGQAISFAFIVLLIRDLGLEGFGSYAMGMAVVAIGALTVD
jgi:O-antigen/teichoic acid export membrane protein